MNQMLEILTQTIEILRRDLSQAATEQDHAKFENVLTQIASFKRVLGYYKGEGDGLCS